MIGLDEAIHAEVELRHCGADLWLNGFPLRRRRHPGDPFASIPVHWYLVNGQNKLEVVVEPGARPTLSREHTGYRRLIGASAIGRLIRYPIGAITDPDNGTLLGEINWQPPDDRDEAYPLVLSANIDVRTPFPRWAWQDAPVLTLDEATQKEALSVLSRAHEAFDRGEVKAMLDLLKVRFDEGLSAHPHADRKTLEEELKGWVEEVASDEVEVLPLAPERHDMRLCAGGRVLELIDQDNRPSQRYRTEDDEGDDVTGYPMMLARVGGRLAIVR